MSTKHLSVTAFLSAEATEEETDALMESVYARLGEKAVAGGLIVLSFSLITQVLPAKDFGSRVLVNLVGTCLPREMIEAQQRMQALAGAGVLPSAPRGPRRSS